MDITGKKLLILGANHETIPIIETAKKLGAIVHVTDFNPEAPAKKYCDYAHNIDCLDIESLQIVCKNEKIEGVMVGVADSLVSAYYELCTKMNFICYSNEIQSKVFTNKLLFNKICDKFEISCVPNFKLEELDSLNFSHPLFVKPVDGNSGKGMSICYNNRELSEAIQIAQKESKSKKYLIEKYMDCDDLLIYYTFFNGQPYLSAIADRFTIKQNNKGSRVCSLAVYPSKYWIKYKSELEQKILRLFKSLNVKNGVFLISAFFENDTFYLYDPGFRLQGEAPDVHIENINGFNQREFLINNALTEDYKLNNTKIGDFKFDGFRAATIWLLLKKGEIYKIEGLNEIRQRNSVIKVLQRFTEGEKITSNMIGTERQVFCRIYLNIKTEDLNILLQEIKIIKGIVKVTDINKKNLIVDDNSRS